MLVATTRKSATDRGVLFLGERGDAVTYTGLAVFIPPDTTYQPGSGQWLKSLPGNPTTNFVALRSDPLNHGKFALGEVVALLGKYLADGQLISDGQVGIGDRLVSMAAGAASMVATGAALAVAAPWPS